MKTTKILTKVTAALTVGAVLASFALHAVKPNYSDVSEDHWAYEQICSVTEAGLMVGMGENEGEYFGWHLPVRGTEIFATLYRLAGNPDVVPTFVDELGIKLKDENSDKEKWYTDSWLWAMYNGVCGIEWVVDNHNSQGFFTEIKRGRYGSEVRPAEYWKYDVVYRAMYGDERDALEYASRADVILSLYFYVTTYLGVDVTETADLSKFSDWSDDELIPYDKYTTGKFGYVNEKTISEELKAACEWAVGAGIIVGYPDGTLGLQSIWDIDFSGCEFWLGRTPNVVSRAEYAVILDRFMDYCENLK